MLLPLPTEALLTTKEAQGSHRHHPCSSPRSLLLTTTTMYTKAPISKAPRHRMWCEWRMYVAKVQKLGFVTYQSPKARIRLERLATKLLATLASASQQNLTTTSELVEPLATTPKLVGVLYSSLSSWPTTCSLQTPLAASCHPCGRQ